MDITHELRLKCGHDSRDVDGCATCEAAALIESLRQQLAAALNEGLRLQVAIDEVRNVYAKALRDQEKDLKQQLADSQKQVATLHFGLFTSANYIDTLGGTSIEARRTLAATEPKP